MTIVVYDPADKVIFVDSFSAAPSRALSSVVAKVMFFGDPQSPITVVAAAGYDFHCEMVAAFLHDAILARPSASAYSIHLPGIPSLNVSGFARSIHRGAVLRVEAGGDYISAVPVWPLAYPSAVGAGEAVFYAHLSNRPGDTLAALSAVCREHPLCGGPISAIHPDLSVSIISTQE